MKGCTETDQKRVTEGWGGVSEYGVLGGMGVNGVSFMYPREGAGRGLSNSKVT